VIRVAVLGATGRMGRHVLAETIDAPDLELVAAISRSHHGTDVGALAGRPPVGVALTGVGPRCLNGAHVVVDFSLPEGLMAALPHFEGAALVSGTTGLSDAEQAALDAAGIPLVQAANFSTGVNVLLDLVTRAAAALTDYDIEIFEAHHKHKVDSPSGTALALGAAVEAARGPSKVRHGREGYSPREDGEIGYHALRGGDVVGEHQVWIAGQGDRLMLGHVATSRATFALGALRAARWLVGKPAGVYTMRNVLGLDGVSDGPNPA